MTCPRNRPCQDAGPVTLETESVLGVLPGSSEPLAAEASGVVDEVPIDNIGEPPFQRSDGFLGVLPFSILLADRNDEDSRRNYKSAPRPESNQLGFPSRRCLTSTRATHRELLTVSRRSPLVAVALDERQTAPRNRQVSTTATPRDPLDNVRRQIDAQVREIGTCASGRRSRMCATVADRKLFIYLIGVPHPGQV